MVGAPSLVNSSRRYPPPTFLTHTHTHTHIYKEREREREHSLGNSVTYRSPRPVSFPFFFLLAFSIRGILLSLPDPNRDLVVLLANFCGEFRWSCMYAGGVQTDGLPREGILLSTTAPGCNTKKRCQREFCLACVPNKSKRRRMDVKWWRRLLL